MTTRRDRLVLLLKEIDDKFVQENFWRLKLYLEQLETGAGGATTNITNITQADSPWEQVTTMVPASTTQVVDTLALSSFGCLNYVVCMKETGGTKTKMFKLDVRNADTVMNDQVYAKEGDNLSVAVNSNISGANFELEFINSETFGIDVTFTRLTQ